MARPPPPVLCKAIGTFSLIQWAPTGARFTQEGALCTGIAYGKYAPQERRQHTVRIWRFEGCLCLCQLTAGCWISHPNQSIIFFPPASRLLTFCQPFASFSLPLAIPSSLLAALPLCRIIGTAPCRAWPPSTTWLICNPVRVQRTTIQVPTPIYLQPGPPRNSLSSFTTMPNFSSLPASSPAPSNGLLSPLTAHQRHLSAKEKLLSLSRRQMRTLESWYQDNPKPSRFSKIVLIESFGGDKSQVGAIHVSRRSLCSRLPTNSILTAVVCPTTSNRAQGEIPCSYTIGSYTKPPWTVAGASSLSPVPQS